MNFEALFWVIAYLNLAFQNKIKAKEYKNIAQKY